MLRSENVSYAVDYPEDDQRFKIVYLLLSHEFNTRIIIQFGIGEGEKIPSLTKIYPSANWMEREVFDMYEVRYSEEAKKVIYEPVKLEQNYRNFDYESPWEGTKYIKNQTKK